MTLLHILAYFLLVPIFELFMKKFLTNFLHIKMAVLWYGITQKELEKLIDFFEFLQTISKAFRETIIKKTLCINTISKWSVIHA